MNISQLFSTLFDNIVPFTLLLGVLVFVHELGHFLVARFCGVRVEVFSLGFGKKILSYKRGDTTYCISLVPLGGYVKMYGEQGGDIVPEEERKHSFTHKTVWQRIAIVLAGPLMNFFFAVAIFALIAFTGEETRSAKIPEVIPGSVAALAGIKSDDTVIAVDDKPVRSYEEFQKALNKFQNSEVTLLIQEQLQEPRKVTVKVGEKENPNIFSTLKKIADIEGIVPYTKGTLVAVAFGSVAEKAGLKTGDEIVAINSSPVTTWATLNKLTLKSVSSSQPITLTIKRTQQLSKDNAASEKSETLNFTFHQNDLFVFKNMSSVMDLGIELPELYLEQVAPGSPAEKAGFEKYDKILSIDGVKVSAWEDVLNKIKSYDGKEALTVGILRDGTESLKKVTPQVTSQMTFQGKEDRRYTIGIVSMNNIANPETVIVKEDNLFVATGKGFQRAVDISVITVMSFVRMFQGEVSYKNIGGMVSIGKVAKDSYQMGLQQFLMTMSILSISLFILNLLPIPVLDGGHLVFYTVELIKGSPLSIKKIELAHQVGFALLMALMVLALFNDFTKFLF